MALFTSLSQTYPFAYVEIGTQASGSRAWRGGDMDFDIACFIDGPEADNQWAHVVGHFLPREIYTFAGGGRCKPFLHCASFVHASELPGPLVLVSPQSARNHPGKKPLAEFIHPAECCYLFGPDHSALVMDHAPDHAVFIDYPGDLQMFSWAAASVVLYDRLVKRG